jgi:hypothetical protein
VVSVSISLEKKVGNQMKYELSIGKEYGQCVHCDRVFIIDQYASAGFCNYDKSTLRRIGRVYPSTPVKVGA